MIGKTLHVLARRLRGISRLVCSARLACVLAAFVSVAGCDEKLSSLTGPSPALEPTFTSIQQEIFTTTDSAGRSACIVCHSNVGRAPAAGLVLLPGVAYNNVVNVPSRNKAGATLIIPGDPENSYLVQKLEGNSGITGVRMPLGGPYLTDGQLLVLKTWIQRGAPNN